jgi:hypothetical protein
MRYLTRDIRGNIRKSRRLASAGCIFWMAFVLAACTTTTSSRMYPVRGVSDAKDMRAVADAVAGTPLSNSQINKLHQDIQKDPGVRSAVQSVANSLEGQKPAMKYSPATGKRYAPNLEFDPETGVKLLPVE